jgi:hypothetical protein
VSLSSVSVHRFSYYYFVRSLHAYTQQVICDDVVLFGVHGAGDFNGRRKAPWRAPVKQWLYPDNRHDIKRLAMHRSESQVNDTNYDAAAGFEFTEAGGSNYLKYRATLTEFRKSPYTCCRQTYFPIRLRAPCVLLVYLSWIYT